VALDRRPVRRVEADPDASIDRNAWWSSLPAIRAVLDDGLDLPAGVTFLVGENGSGKSTIVEGLAQAYGLNVEGGSVYAMQCTRPTESPLGQALRLVKSPFQAPAYFLRGGDDARPLQLPGNRDNPRPASPPTATDTSAATARASSTCWPTSSAATASS
jgi:AAA domain (dynein-related subfamily)